MIWWDQDGLGIGQVERGKETETEEDGEGEGEGGTIICRGRWRRGGDWKVRREPGLEIGY